MEVMRKNDPFAPNKTIVAGTNGRQEEKNSTKQDQQNALPESPLNGERLEQNAKVPGLNQQNFANQNLNLAANQNTSVTVSEDGTSRSLNIESQRDGKLAVVFGVESNGEKVIKSYSVDSIEELAEKDQAAFDFYKQHVAAPQDGGLLNGGLLNGGWQNGGPENKALQMLNSQMGGSAGGPISVGPASGGSSIAIAGGSARASAGGSASGSSMQSTGSSVGPTSGSYPRTGGNSSWNTNTGFAWQTDSSVSRNGRTFNQRRSGSGGNSKTGGAAKQEMIQQLQQMIERTDDPQAKQQLRNMIQQISRN